MNITGTILADAHNEAAGVLHRILMPITEREGLLRTRRAFAMRNLVQLRVLREMIDEKIAENVDVCRLSGGKYSDWDAPSWADIGAALGVSKQAAQAKFTPKK